MPSIALVIFREALEIALIVSVILAATRGIAGRTRWILLGVGGGLAGAGLVAGFTDKIAEWGEGVGQEMMNASILLVAALFIGWTVVWMKHHAREVVVQFKHIGEQIRDGKRHFISLSIVIALAILREGSEIVLFSYGQLLSGQSVASLLTGCALGGAAGFGLGAVLYLGLIKIPTHRIFSVTSWLLILLVAGLASQAAGFLVQANYFDSLSAVMWDSSALLSEQGMLGQILKVLIGYTEQPMQIQLIFYGATIALLLTMLKWMDKKHIHHHHTSASVTAKA